MTPAVFIRRYTSELGWRLLPVERGGKLPLWIGWPKRATADPEAALPWLARYPRGVNLGMACGPASGVFVLDVDRHEGAADGGASLAKLERRHGALPATAEQRTGGDGRQLVFAYPAGRTIRNSAGKLAPGLDVRGEGGFVLLPPSLHPSGNLYRWREDRAPWETPPAEAPAWLLNRLDPPPAPPVASPPPRPRSPAGASAYARVALERELAAVATAPRGTRDHALNRAAYALGGLAAAGALDLADVAWELAAVGLAAGLPEREVRLTLASGLRAGAAHPREVA